MNKELKHNYEYDVRLDTETAPAKVIRMVGENKRILEIGAGPGSITKHLKHTGNCHITALEIDDEAIKKLKPFCDKVYQINLNAVDWDQQLAHEDKFEVIIAADVLEHLYSPLTTLNTMKKLLSKDGYMVISLPHIGYSAIHACLFDEDFEYNDFGLLDKTHIRFFGIKNIQKLFADAEMKIIQAEFVVRKPEYTEFAKYWAKISQELRNELAKNPFGSVYQVVLKAVPITSEGDAISLMSMVVQPVIFSFRDSLIAFLHLHLSEKMYTKLLQLNKLRHKFFVKKPK